MDYEASYEIVVGVDYGTTTTSVAWALSTIPEGAELDLISTFPPSKESKQAPSRLSLPEDNLQQHQRDTKWGYEVGPDQVSCSWTKLLLFPRDAKHAMDDQELEKFSATGIFHLPSSMDAEGVVRRFLKLLHRHVMNHLRRRITISLNNIPIRFYFGRPAMWSRKDSNSFENRILCKAGFGARHADKIIIIPEPQAAAYTVFKRHQSEFKVHDRVLICDLGGGTADFSSYYVTSMKPVSLRSIRDGTGFKCGGTVVDRQFYLEMAQTFGSDWDSIPATLKGQGSRLMQDFEEVKTKFDGETEISEIKILGRRINQILGRPKSLVVLTPEIIRRFFDPVVMQITILIERQLEKAKGYRFMNRIILVGGLSSSPYVQHKLFRTFNEPDKLRVITTLNPELAVVRGLVYRGLETRPTGVQKSPQFYGIGLGPLGEATTPDQQNKVDSEDDTTKVRERVEWVLSKHGEYLPEFCHKLEKTIFHTFPTDPLLKTVKIYSCDLSIGPEHVDDHDIDIAGLILVKLAELPPRYLSSRQNIIPAVICTTPGREPDILEFTVEVEGCVIGKRTIKMEE